MSSLLKISPKNHIFLKSFKSEFQVNKVWSTDQNSQPLEREDITNLTPLIKKYNHYKNEIFNWIYVKE